MAIDLQKLEQKFNALLNDTNFVNDFEQWLESRNVSQNAAKPIVSGSLPFAKMMGFDSINAECPICKQRYNRPIGGNDR